MPRWNITSLLDKKRLQLWQKKSPAEKQAAADDVQARLQVFPNLHDILVFARSEGVQLSFDESLVLEGVSARVDWADKKIRLNPVRLRDAESIAEIIHDAYEDWRTQARQEWADTPQTKKDERLQNIIDMVRIVPLTQNMACFLEGLRTRICFEPTLIGTTLHALASFEDNAIYLNPAIDNLSDEVESLVHEGRHMWQFAQLQLKPEEYIRLRRASSVSSLALVRVMEADAFAFTALFIQSMSDMVQKYHEKDAAGAASPFGRLILRNQLEMDCERLKHTEYKSKIREDFFASLQQLAVYDSRSLQYYNRQSVLRTKTPPQSAAEDLRVLQKLQNMLKVGIEDFAPGYLNDMDTLRFGAAVFQDMAPDARRTFRLMKEFDRAARRADVSACRKLTEKIQKTIKAAQARPLMRLSG